MLALGGEEFSPGNDLRVLLEQGAALTLGHASPHAELHPIVEGVGTAFQDYRAMPADDRGFALRGPAYKELVGVSLTTACL
jgi:hypothetical protein